MSFGGRLEGADYSDDCDFSDEVLRYINQMLMEEDLETCALQNSLDLQAAEKSFYDVIGKRYPPTVETCSTSYYGCSDEHYIGNAYENFSNFVSSSSDSCSVNNFLNICGENILFHATQPLSFGVSNVVMNISDRPEDSLNCARQAPDGYDGRASGNFSNSVSTSSDSCSINNKLSGYGASRGENVLFHGTPHSLFDVSNATINIPDGGEDSLSSAHQAPDSYERGQLVCQFMKGIEDASKFLPSIPNLIVNLNHNGLVSSPPEGASDGPTIKLEERGDLEHLPSEPRGKKNPYVEEINSEEERSSKQPAVYSDSNLVSKMSDDILLCHAGESTSPLITLQESLQNETKKIEQQGAEEKGSTGKKGRGKKRNTKKEVVDLRSLLILCAQAVAANDRRTANELLKQIRQHSSSIGDGNQRLAHLFANGLEARLAGAGSQIYKGLISKKTFTADILKAYHLYIAACPFRKISNFFSNRMIMNAAANSMRLHIIDFGILYGFQWPTFFQRISSREGGPPKVRITAIEYPQPGFRPAELVEDTGHRIATYAERFKVPFEYNAIAKKWEAIQIEELKLDKNEVLAVNSLNVFQNLLDESVAVNSVRNSVLNMIRKINPDLFILGVINGTYNAPFFVTRFREALFHFSSIFDMLDTNVPRGHYERMLLEREIFGKKALNVIACEGCERVERPETYKQWQVRQLRAGFRQLPLDKQIMGKAVERVNSRYHKDFVIDEDSQWLLQGWKGRTLYALSTWKPV